MRVPLSWLREYVDFELSPDALAERLTVLGMEVQKIERRGDGWRDVVVGELLEVRRHPNADRLSLTRVTVGDGTSPLSIVCGATNIRAGQRVPVALPGAVLPGERRIGVTAIAGVESQGMLCSGGELELTSDADGILILPPDSPLGRPLADLYGDVVLDVDVKPNRGDALSLVGLAREVAAATGGRLRFPDTRPPEAGDATADHVAVTVREPGLCPRFVARYVDGVRVARSPERVQMRLLAAGLRPVSNVVDASNYVMLELGKPTHTFDAAAISGRRLEVRLAAAGERIETLDHIVRELTSDTLVIADAGGPAAIAGVMGGAASEVGEATTAIIIESAIFDPVSIRRTAQRYALRSEASLRFEKGQEWRLARLGADRLAALLAKWAGGRVAVGAVDTSSSEPAPGRVSFRPQRVNRLLGVSLGVDEMRDLLGAVEVSTEPDGDDRLTAIVPSHRRDLETEADLAVEGIRVRGYETVPPLLPASAPPPYRPDPEAPLHEIRELLSGRGLSEVVAHALVAPDDHARVAVPADDPATIRVANPVAADHSQLRRSLLPGLARVLLHNERARRADVAIFEIGHVHQWTDHMPSESKRLGLLLAGDWRPRAWSEPAGGEADAIEVKGLVSWLLDRLGQPAVRFGAATPIDGLEHPGRISEVLVGEGAGSTAVGRVGELDARYLAALESRASRVAFAELDLEAVLAATPATPRFRPVARFPAVERDLAVVVDERVPAGALEERIRSVAGDILQELRLFDRYEGPQVGPGELSLGYRLRLQAPGRTLTDEEVDRLVDRVVAQLAQEFGARMRG